VVRNKSWRKGLALFSREVEPAPFYFDSQPNLAMGLLMLGLLWSIVGCMGYVPGAKSYWDEQVKAMCKEDGGVTVYERVRISRDQINRRVLPMAADGRLSFTTKELAHPDAPIYSVERVVSQIRDRNPRVRRIESTIVRRIDQVVVAKHVIYARVGGDVPTGLSEGTSFICPDLQKLTSDLHEQLFIIEGDLR
jgi:hypothetical protein